MARARRRAAPGRRGDGGRRRRRTPSTWTASGSSSAGWRSRPARRRDRSRAPRRSARSRTRRRSARCSSEGSGHLAVLGGGFIGVEAAASARMKGLEVTLAMQNEVIWDHLFGAEVGRYFQRHMEDHGVRILSGRDGLPDDLEADMVRRRHRRHAERRPGEGRGARGRHRRADGRPPAGGARRLGGRRHRRVPERDPRPADPRRALGRRPQPRRLRRPAVGGQGGRPVRRRALLLLRPRPTGRGWSTSGRARPATRWTSAARWPTTTSSRTTPTRTAS